MELIKTLYQLKKDIADRRSDVAFAGKLDRFEALIDADPDLDDCKAVMYLYGKKKVTMAYRALKYRMEERLMNDLIKYSSEEKNTRSRVYMKIVVDKYLLVASLLMKNFQRKSAIPILEKALGIAEKYSYPAEVLSIAKTLSNHYGFVEVDRKKMTYFLDMARRVSATVHAETYVSECYVIVSNLVYMTKGAYTKKQISEIKEMTIKLQKIKAEHKSNYILFNTNDIINFYYQAIGDFQGSLRLGYESLEEILALDNNDLFGVFKCKFNISVSHFYLQHYDEADWWFEDTLKILTKGTPNWFHVTLIQFLNHLYAGKLDKLAQLTLEVINNNNLKKNPYFHELWEVREAFFQLLLKVGKINLQPEQNKLVRPFSLIRFLNNLPHHAKDKSGLNITILILQVIFLLLDRKYNQIIDRVDALTQYTYRYLRNDDTFRSNCFIKMLILMEKADFHPVRTRTMTDGLYRKLTGSRIITDIKNPQVEIMPYDYLWNIIMEILETNHKKGR